MGVEAEARVKAGLCLWTAVPVCIEGEGCVSNLPSCFNEKCIREAKT